METAKNVLVQINSLTLGGTQINAIDLAKAVQAHGYRSFLFGPLSTLPMAGPNVMEVAEARGVSIGGYWPESGSVLNRAKALSARASEVNADVIHVYGTGGDPRSAYLAPCFSGRLPLVHTVYEMAIAPGTFRHSSLVVGTGYLRDEPLGRPGPTTLISPPVDVVADAPDPESRSRFRASLGDVGSRPMVAVVSRLDLDMKYLPLENSIRTMELLADTEAVLVVVGAGTEEARLREIGRSVNERVGRTMIHFTGAMSDPRPAYAAADIMLGMGGSAARSLAFAAPLIVQGERGTAELFEQRSATDIFRRSFWSPRPEPNSIGVLSDLLRRLLGDPVRRGQLGEFGRRFALDNFSLAAMSKRLATACDKSSSTYGRLAWLRDLSCEIPKIAEGIGRRVSRLR